MSDCASPEGDSETIDMLFFFASAVIIIKKYKEDHIYFVKKYKSKTFTLDHCPSKDEVKELFVYENIHSIKILSLQQWSQEQYETY